MGSCVGGIMKKIRDIIQHWIRVFRMSSGELAALTLPPWVLTGLHLRNNVKQDYIGLISAGVAFYFLLSAFPALGAAISIFGLFFDPYEVTTLIERMASFLPREALDIIITQGRNIAQTTGSTLSISLGISILLAVYSATRGVQALIKGFNIAYDATETRGMFRLTFLSYGLTLLMLGYFLFSLLLVAGLPVAIQFLHLPPVFSSLLQWSRWPVLFFTALVGLEILYSLGPCRKRGRIGISAGAFGATVLWMLGSSLFSLFISNFASFNETYGSLGAVVVLLMWFWMSAMSILIGAEVNGALEGTARGRDDSH